MTLREFITNKGYTIEEWQKCANELFKNGIGKGCYQDYVLLTLVINWLTKYDNENEEEM